MREKDKRKTNSRPAVYRSKLGKRDAAETGLSVTTGNANDAVEAPVHGMRVTEGEVIAVESHPKSPGMYRLAIRLTGERQTGAEAEPDSNAAAGKPNRGQGNWHDEVDALIADAAFAGANEEQTVAHVTVHEDTFVAMRLLKGRILSGDEWEHLRSEETMEEAYRAALAILDRKARTSRELAQALKRKGFPEEAIQSCLKRLQERRMLDDSSYARRYTEQKATGQRKGRRLIRQELLQRGIAKEVADRALGELDEDTELEAALTLARKKWPQLKGELRDRKMKLAAFLLRRGYPQGVARQAMARVQEEASRIEHDMAVDEFGSGIHHMADTEDWEPAGIEEPDEP